MMLERLQGDVEESRNLSVRRRIGREIIVNDTYSDKNIIISD